MMIPESHTLTRKLRESRGITFRDEIGAHSIPDEDDDVAIVLWDWGAFAERDVGLNAEEKREQASEREGGSRFDQRGKRPTSNVQRPTFNEEKAPGRL